MPIQYVEPLKSAFERMKSMLFRPFNLEIWMVMGFTAWLARLWDNAGMGGGNKWRNGASYRDYDSDFILRRGPDHWEVGDFDWWGLGGLEVGIVLVLIFFGIAFAVLLAWLSSRGEFMFLDNVVHKRAKVSDPWRDFARQADSLFLWRIAVQIVAGIVAIAFILPALFMIIPISEGGVWRGLGVFGAVMLGLFGIGLGIVATLVSFWTDQFVVPIMYKRGLTILDAWRVFLPLLQERIGPLFLYALFFLVLSIGVGVAVMAAGLVTCCVGWLVLTIPYIGTVIMLPIYVTGRSLGPEFMGQFGDEYRLWSDDAATDESAAGDQPETGDDTPIDQGP
jgi:hypothetical protein